MTLVAFGFPLHLAAQQGAAGSAAMRARPDFRTVRPFIRGRDYAVSSMKAQATAAAVEILNGVLAAGVDPRTEGVAWAK